ncbi:MAG: type II secretion system protein [Candidatus Omnitrophica bacterium]|nr:type II secretion system protein [Candidatus Omnitrophota bacterium]
MRKNKNGFMLLEVLLSVFIVTVGVVFVIGSFMTSVRAFRSTRAYLEALYLLEEKMWEYEEAGAVEEGSESGRFDDRRYAEWELKAEEVDDFPLNHVEFVITLKKDGGETTFKINTYLFNGESLDL